MGSFNKPSAPRADQIDQLCCIKLLGHSGRSFFKRRARLTAIADLQGRFDLLEMALAKIADHAELPGTIVTLGDYVDRGPDSRQVIERLMGGLGREGWRLICLKGNHEDIM